MNWSFFVDTGANNVRNLIFSFVPNFNNSVSAFIIGKKPHVELLMNLFYTSFSSRNQSLLFCWYWKVIHTPAERRARSSLERKILHTISELGGLILSNSFKDGRHDYFKILLDKLFVNEAHTFWENIVHQDATNRSINHFSIEEKLDRSIYRNDIVLISQDSLIHRSECLTHTLSFWLDMSQVVSTQNHIQCCRNNWFSRSRLKQVLG